MENEASLQVTESGTVDSSTAAKWSLEQGHESCRKLAYWLRTKKRPVHLVTDEEFHNFCVKNSAQKSDCCSEKEIDEQVLEMVATVNLHNKKTMSTLKPDGIIPSMASDIWSDSNV